MFIELRELLYSGAIRRHQLGAKDLLTPTSSHIRIRPNFKLFFVFDIFFHLSGICHAILIENSLQSRCTAGMNSGDGHVVSLCLLSGSNYHFMGNGIGKQDQKIRTADLFSHRSVLLREYLGLAAITFTDI